MINIPQHKISKYTYNTNKMAGQLRNLLNVFQETQSKRNIITSLISVPRMFLLKLPLFEFYKNRKKEAYLHQERINQLKVEYHHVLYKEFMRKKCAKRTSTEVLNDLSDAIWEKEYPLTNKIVTPDHIRKISEKVIENTYLITREFLNSAEVIERIVEIQFFLSSIKRKNYSVNEEDLAELYDLRLQLKISMSSVISDIERKI